MLSLPRLHFLALAFSLTLLRSRSFILVLSLSFSLPHFAYTFALVLLSFVFLLLLPHFCSTIFFFYKTLYDLMSHLVMECRRCFLHINLPIRTSHHNIFVCRQKWKYFYCVIQTQAIDWVNLIGSVVLKFNNLRVFQLASARVKIHDQSRCVYYTWRETLLYLLKNIKTIDLLSRIRNVITNFYKNIRIFTGVSFFYIIIYNLLLNLLCKDIF